MLAKCPYRVGWLTSIGAPGSELSAWRSAGRGSHGSARGRYTGAEYGELVEAIAVKERIAKDQVILGEILEPLGTHLSLQGGAGGEFIYSDPGYTALIDSAVAVGGRALAVPLNARLENDLPAIAAHLNDHTRAVYLVNPHNPTGIVCEPDQLRSFARSTARRALVIVATNRSTNTTKMT